MSDDNDPGQLLDELTELRSRARNDRRATSTPLFVLGVVTLVASLLPDGATSVPGSYLWLAAGPLVFVVTATAFRRREIHQGIGTPARPYRITAIVLLAAFLLLFPLAATFGAAMAAVGIGLLVLAAQQRNLTLGIVATVFGTVGVLQSMFIVANAVWHLTGVSIASGVVIATLAAGILATALIARRRESASG